MSGGGTGLMSGGGLSMGSTGLGKSGSGGCSRMRSLLQQRCRRPGVYFGSTARILYVSDSIFLPSMLTDHFSFALSPSNSPWMSSTSGMRQLRWADWPCSN